MRTIHVWPRRLEEFLLTHPLYKSPTFHTYPAKSRIRNTRARAREAYIGAGFGVAASMSPDDFAKPADLPQPRAEENKMPAEAWLQTTLVP